jgi:hypothetical protein
VPFTLNKDHVEALLRPHLEPGEEVLFKSYGFHAPWWDITSFFYRYYLLAGTPRRLMLLGLTGLLKEKSFLSIGWGELTDIGLGWGLVTKTLRFSAPRLGLRYKLKMPWKFLGPQAHLTGPRAVFEALQQQKALPASQVISA